MSAIREYREMVNVLAKTYSPCSCPNGPEWETSERRRTSAACGCRTASCRVPKGENGSLHFDGRHWNFGCLIRHLLDQIEQAEKLDHARFLARKEARE